jgi:hypothetical protein
MAKITKAQERKNAVNSVMVWQSFFVEARYKSEYYMAIREIDCSDHVAKYWRVETIVQRDRVARAIDKAVELDAMHDHRM